MSDTDVAPEPKTWPSIDDAVPKEQGGPIARQGFTYQDEIAVGFLLDMIEDPGLAKVHFETHDDLVLVRAAEAGQGQMIAEFVQVKSGEPDKLWSVADICHRKKKDAVGTSILEISIGRDEHEEVAAFRMVTLRDVVSDLAPLTYLFDADGRKPGCKAMTALERVLNERLPGLSSPKENGCGYWLKNCFWDVRYDREAVEKANTIRVFRLAQQAGQPLLIEQIDVLLNEMRAWVKAAGDAKWASDKVKKIVPREDALEWWEKRLAKVAQGADAPSGGALADKMQAAALPKTLIAMAVDLRRSYSAKVRTATYMDTGTADALTDQVKSRVQSLGAELAAGLINMDGLQFHARCLAEMQTINDARPKGVEDQSAFLQGCLYDIADRCLLRFDRTTL